MKKTFDTSAKSPANGGWFAESLVNELDEIRQRIGVDRSALIKVWLMRG